MFSFSYTPLHFGGADALGSYPSTITSEVYVSILCLMFDAYTRHVAYLDQKCKLGKRAAHSALQSSTGMGTMTGELYIDLDDE
jgi:hypothetical protein